MSAHRRSGPVEDGARPGLLDLGLVPADPDRRIVVPRPGDGRVACTLVVLEEDRDTEAPEPVTEPAPSVVRAFVRTGGRSLVLDDLRLESLVSTTGAGEGGALRTASDQERILSVCRSPRSVAEIISTLQMPLTIVLVLVTDGVSRGLLAVNRYRWGSGGRSDDVLLDRLRTALSRIA